MPAPWPFVVRFTDGTETVIRSHAHHAELMVRCRGRHENAHMMVGGQHYVGCWRCLSADALEVGFDA